MRTTLVRVTTPMAKGDDLVWHFRLVTEDEQQALRWIRANPQVVEAATAEVIPGF
jgi:hypothetical protein